MIKKWLQWFRKKQHPRAYPDYWNTYLKHCAEPVKPNTLLEEVPFVVFDTETTGLNVKSDQILSIGAVCVRNNKIIVKDNLDFFVHQVYEPVKAVVEIHGILPKGRDNSLEEKAALQRFIAFIKNSVLVGHHVGFDMAIINEALKERVGGKLCNVAIDTMVLAQRLMPPSPYAPPARQSLDALCRQYHIPLDDRHTAAGDAFLTALLFLKLTRRLQQRGVRTLGDLLRQR